MGRAGRTRAVLLGSAKRRSLDHVSAVLDRRVGGCAIHRCCVSPSDGCASRVRQVISGSKKALTAGSKIKFGQSTRDYFVSFSEGDGRTFETPSMRGETKGLIMTDHGMKRSRWVDEEEEEEGGKMRRTEEEHAGGRQKPTPVPKVLCCTCFPHVLRKRSHVVAGAS